MSSTKKKSGSDDQVVPGPDTFDFNEYISGKSTFPEFSHTVYLDQATGIELAQLAEEYEGLADRGKVLQRKLRSLGESSVRSFVDMDREELTDELEEIQGKTSGLEERIQFLEKKVVKSGLTLHFQAGTAQKLGTIVRNAEKEYHKKHGRGADDDLEYLSKKTKYVLVAQLVGYCTKVVLPDGVQQNPPAREGFERLLDSLISSESVRLLETLNKSLDSSQDWAERLDAGFPGGSSDLGDGEVGGSSTEDSESMVGSSPDPADG